MNYFPTMTNSIFTLIFILAASVKILAAGGDFDLKLNEGFTVFPFTVDGAFQAAGVRQKTGESVSEQAEPGGIVLSAIPATTYTVTSTVGFGAGTLPKAVSDAEGVSPGADIIVFNIPTSDPGYNAATGVWTINLGSRLSWSEPLTIDGTSQPGYSGTPRIELNGANFSDNAIKISGSSSILRGLAINRSPGYGIQLSGGGGHRIEANFIGTDASGMLNRGNRSGGIDIQSSSSNVIGGAASGVGNLISANLRGISINNGSTNNKIQSNRIGTDKDGSTALGNSAGVEVKGSDNNIIGVAADGTGAGNIIAYNSGAGISIISEFNISSSGNRISRNSFFDNGRRGIVLGNGADIPNDNCDTDTGANNLQNYPVISSAVSDNSTTTIQGTLNSAPNATYRIELFSNQSCHALGRGEGKTFIGAVTVTTDASCAASFTYANAAPTANGQVITATAIDAAGNTSEFAACATVTNTAPSPTPTPSATPTPTPTPPSCTYSIAPEGTTGVVAAGGTGYTVTVAAPAGCAWTAVSAISWITITFGASGSGSGTVTYSVAANNTGLGRVGNMTVAGLVFLVGQNDACTITISPSEQTFSAGGGSGVVNVATNYPSCRWEAAENGYASVYPGPFITVPQETAGQGNGSFTFSVGPNPPQIGRLGRAGTIVIYLHNLNHYGESVNYTIFQPDSNGCYYLFTPHAAEFDARAPSGNYQVGSVSVSAPAACNWSATNFSPWIRADSRVRSGNDTIFYEVDNNDGEYRTGDFELGGQLLTVRQLAYSRCPVLYVYCLLFPSLCPSGPSSSPAAGSLFGQIYGFRDEVLAKTPRGKKYTEDYYQYAGEITKLLIFNPRLISRSKDVFQRYQPVVESMLNGERARADKIRSGEMASDQAVVGPTVVTDSEMDDVDELLNSFSAQASGQLRQTLDGLRRDIRDPEVQAEFGIQVRRGEKRPLPDDGAKPSGLIGALSSFDFKSGLEFLNPFSRDIPVAETAGGDQATQRDPAPAVDTYGQIPLSFEANRGQVDKQVKYLSRGMGYNLFLTRAEAVLTMGKSPRSKDQSSPMSKVQGPKSGTLDSEVLESDTLRMKLDGANLAPRIAGREELPGKSNYLIGNDSRNWRSGIPNFSKVEYKQVYKGVDLIYYGNQRQLEYDFKVAQGADPKKIGMNFTGADKIELDDHGDLLLHIGNKDVRMHAPVTFQEIDGVRHEIASRYVLRRSPKSEVQSPKSESATLDTEHWTLDSSKKSVGFEVADYDTSKPLVIDPVLVYSTYLGGSGDDEANSIAVDAAGNAYVIGFTDSTNFPVVNARQSTYGGNPQDVFVSKINPAGTALVYSTYLGGSGQDNGGDIAVDAAGNAYITGYTGSTNFPTASAMQATRTGFYNAFVAKLNPTGSQLVYSTYFGGTIGEFGSAIAVDSGGNAYVGGVTSSPDFPKLNPIQLNYGGNLADAFVTKFNAAGSQIVYSTYLGGNGNDGVTGIAIDPTGNAYVTGVTFSTNFPTATPLQANFRGGAFDAFVAKLNPSGGALVYSTYLGGTDEDRGFRIAADNAGNAYVAGMTLSQNFPTAAALQPTFGGGSDAFITKLNPAGAISYSTFLGGSGPDGATGLAVSPPGNVYVTGFTTSPNFPLADPSQPLYNGGVFDAFVTKLNAGGTALAYSTYLGGALYDTGFDIAVDSSGNGYVLGRTASTNFPTVGALQPQNGGGAFDLFITKLTANVAVSGRVLTPDGRSLRNAVVSLIDGTGFRRTATTSSFGLYSFADVRTGDTYTITVSSKRYRFTPQIMPINDNLANLDFVGLE